MEFMHIKTGEKTILQSETVITKERQPLNGLSFQLSKRKVLQYLLKLVQYKTLVFISSCSEFSIVRRNCFHLLN